MLGEWEALPSLTPSRLLEAEAGCKYAPCEAGDALQQMRAGCPWLGETKLSEIKGAKTNGDFAFTKAVIHCAKEKTIPPLKTKPSHAEMASGVSAMEGESHR